MRFVFLAYSNEATWGTLPAPERDTQMQMFTAFVKEA